MSYDEFNDQEPRPIRMMENLAIAALVLALLSFVSPQVGMIGRGLRTAVPALLVSMVAISRVDRSAFPQAFLRFRMVFLLGLLFLTQALIRFLFVPDHPMDLVHTYVVGPLLTFCFLLWFAALSELGDPVIDRMRSWLLIGWCLSFAVSLPVLISNPGVARLTMGNPNQVANAARWAPYGVAEYTGYTTIAICLSPLLGALGHMSRLLRWPSFLLVMLAVLAVLFSTFTMASAMAVLSLGAMLLVWSIAGRGPARVLRFLVVIMMAALVPTLFVLANSFEQTKFVVEKTERLTRNISNKGLSKGDETERGAWFTNEMSAFAEEPFLGYIPGTTGMRGHGHSSLSNSLVLFGLFGTLLWIGTLLKVFRDSFEHARGRYDRHILLACWTVFILSGVLNPIWYSCAALAALFALTLPARQVQDFPPDWS